MDFYTLYVGPKVYRAVNCTNSTLTFLKYYSVPCSVPIFSRHVLILKHFSPNAGSDHLVLNPLLGTTVFKRHFSTL